MCLIFFPCMRNSLAVQGDMLRSDKRVVQQAHQFKMNNSTYFRLACLMQYILSNALMQLDCRGLRLLEL